MKYELLNPELYIFNRKRFTDRMKPNSIAIFNSNDQMPRNGDQCYPFRQNSNLFYLSGLDQAETVVVLFPDCIKEDFKEIAFIKQGNEHSDVWEGHRYTLKEATATSGIKKIFWLSQMDQVLNELILLSENIYINTNENDHFSTVVPSRDIRFAKKLMDSYPAHQYLRAQPILKKLAMRKTNYEMPVIQHAINITEKAFRRVCDFVRPGVFEYEVEAEIIHEFIRNRANGHAYEPIIASGKNACVLHYNANNQICANGDLLLMDFGAEYANYAADLTRTIPVNGQFSDRQKAVYQSVKKVLDEATNILVPGTTIEDYHKEVGKVMESELKGLGLISKEEIEKQNPERPAYKKYFMHGTSHHLGLDVHDLSNRYDPVMEGMVFTVEPGIYIPEEGIGIRLENNVIVTDQGAVNMMNSIPIEVEEIEELMNASVLG